ncbi:MAG: hypothetical protein FWC39_00480 [Bacteroidetes bacterium]|nr:hypothetical protein [Bacteroidota bacterium]
MAAIALQPYVTLNIPVKEFPLVEPLAKKFKWLITTTKQAKNYTFADLNDASKKSFADADAGKTFKAKNVADLMKQLNS